MANDASGAVPATSSGSKITDYALGSTDRERQRLMRQGAILRDITASAFRAAGIGPGMRVLDVGCGVGDVAILAAEMVGPCGSVVGLDRDAASVAWASRRVAEAGFANIRFQAVELNDFADPQSFDALIGRFILLSFTVSTAVSKRHFAPVFPR